MSLLWVVELRLEPQVSPALTFLLAALPFFLLLCEWSLAWGAVCSLGIQGTASAGCGWLTSLLCCSVRRGCGLWRRRWNSWTSLTRGSASRSSWSTPGTACWRSGTGSPSALRPTQTRSTSSCGGGKSPQRACLSDRLFWLDDRVCVRILFLFYTTWHSHLNEKTSSQQKPMIGSIPAGFSFLFLK